MLNRKFNKVMKLTFSNVSKCVIFDRLQILNCNKIYYKNLSLSACVCKEESNKNLFKGNLRGGALQEIPSKRITVYEVAEKDKAVVESLKKGNIFHPYNGPADRFFGVLKKDVELFGRELLYYTTGIKKGELELQYFPRHTDILIVGGGPIGLLTAYALRSQFPHGPNVTVLDRELDPLRFTNLGQGNIIQQQFKETEELQMSQYCSDFLTTYHRHTAVEGQPPFKAHFEPLGSLLLADESNAESLIQKSETMKMYNVSHKILKREALKEKFPWLNVDGIVFGSLGLRNEGLLDPWSFFNGLKCRAINLGVNFLTAEVVDFAVNDHSPKRVICRLPDNTYNSVDFGYCILATGIETLNLLNIINNTDMSSLKVLLPLEERRRYEYCFYNPDGPGLNVPIVIDSDGVYFRREGLTGYYIAGVPSVPADNTEENGVFEVFQNKVMPFLMKRVPQFEKYQIVRGWIDTYTTNTGNEVGVLGPHPGDCRIIFVNGFSHCGLQYLPAVARAVMENVFYDDYQTIDMTKFHIENLYRRQHLEADERRRKLLKSQEYIALSDVNN